MSLQKVEEHWRQKCEDPKNLQHQSCHWLRVQVFSVEKIGRFIAISLNFLNYRMTYITETLSTQWGTSTTLASAPDKAVTDLRVWNQWPWRHYFYSHFWRSSINKQMTSSSHHSFAFFFINQIYISKFIVYHLSPIFHSLQSSQIHNSSKNQDNLLTILKLFLKKIFKSFYFPRWLYFGCILFVCLYLMLLSYVA